jgi:hypothetical protein
MQTAIKSQQIRTDWVTPASLVSKRDKAIFDLGKQKGKEEVDSDFQERLGKNFELSYIHTTEFLKFLSENNVCVLDARLKLEHLSDLKVAVILKEDETLQEKISLVYDFLYDLEAKNNTEDYNIDFTIIKADERFQGELVEKDGFIFTHQLLDNDGAAKKEKRARS